MDEVGEFGVVREWEGGGVRAMMAVVVGWVGRMVRMEVEMEEVAEVRMIFIVVVGGLVAGLGGGRERCR